MGSKESHMKKAVQKSPEAKKRATYIIGHLQGVGKMIDEGRYCIDVIKQIDAVEGSLKKLKQVMLKNHLQGCVAKSMKSDSQRERSKAIKEILEVYKANER